LNKSKLREEASCVGSTTEMKTRKVDAIYIKQKDTSKQETLGMSLI